MADKFLVTFTKTQVTDARPARQILRNMKAPERPARPLVALRAAVQPRQKRSTKPGPIKAVSFACHGFFKIRMPITFALKKLEKVKPLIPKETKYDVLPKTALLLWCHITKAQRTAISLAVPRPSDLGGLGPKILKTRRFH